MIEIRTLEPAERYVEVDDVVAVDPDGTGVQRVSGGDRLLDVLCEDSCSETVHGVVRKVDQVILVVELGDDDDCEHQSICQF